MGNRITPTDLLAWGIVNQATEKEDRTVPTDPTQHQPIDPKWIDIILGKPDAARMRDCLKIILDKEQTLEVRVANFDELELLVESVDNALDLQALGMWPQLLSILETEEEGELRTYAAWVMGTAVQNNPKAQEAFERARGIPIVLKALDQDQDAQVRIKSLYCISAAVRSNVTTFKTFSESSGFQVCANACKQGDGALLKRTLFFLSTLMQSQDESEVEVQGGTGSVADTTLQAIQEHGLLSMTTDLLNASSDTLPVEEALSFLLSVALFNASAFSNEKANLLSKLASLLPKLEDDDAKSKVNQLSQALLNK